MRISEAHNIPHDQQVTQMIYFSFSLYGDKPKYTRGMVANAALIKARFPEARVTVYTADDVPSDIVDTLRTFDNVTLVPVPRLPENGCAFDRFLAIDISDCDIMISRDADSRVHERDAACIDDFLAAPTAMLHIIRDHKYHTDAIMAGMWGIRKAALTEPMALTLSRWRATRNSTAYTTDQQFLRTIFYERLRSQVMVHDRLGIAAYRWNAGITVTPFRAPIVDDLFIGQVHEYRDDGSEYVVFPA